MGGVMLFIFFAFYSACAFHQEPHFEVPSGQVIINNQGLDEVVCRVRYQAYDPICSGIDYCSFYYDKQSGLWIQSRISQGERAVLGLPQFWPLMENITYRGVGYVEVMCLDDWGKVEDYYYFNQADFPYAGVLYCEVRLEEMACHLDVPRQEWPVQQLAQFPPE